jgi:hypothetical protein
LIASKGVTDLREDCYCGHLDPLPYLDADARREVFGEAERRSLERLVEGGGWGTDATAPTVPERSENGEDPAIRITPGRDRPRLPNAGLTRVEP